MAKGKLAAGAALSRLAMISALSAANPSAAERGETALLQRAFNPPSWSAQSYKNAWRHWDRGLRGPPQPYDAAFRERYGLHPAPYANGDYPMGLREARGLLSKGIATDCLLCHGGSIAGQSSVGLGNPPPEIPALFQDPPVPTPPPPTLPSPF